MKKLLTIIVALGLFYLGLQFLINLLIVTHDVKYSVLTEDNNYEVSEYYNKNGYFFNVLDKNRKKFSFYYVNIFNKQEKIIKNIKYYKSDDLICILPIYKRNIIGNLNCIYNNEQVSYSYLIQNNNTSINNIIDKMRKSGYDLGNNKSSNVKKNENGIFVYYNNIDSDYLYTMWFYKGMYIISRDKTIKKNLLENDSYENKYSSLVGKYYVTFNTDNKNNFRYYELIVYNIQDGGMKKIELDGVSLNSYINGVYDNKMYFTDLDSKVQYEVNPYNGTINKLDNYKFYDNLEFKTIEKKDFFEKEMIFSDNIINKNISDKFGNVEIKVDKDNYYFKTDDGRVYEVINNEYDNPVLLFKFNDLVEWKVKDGIISCVSGDTLYSYSNSMGLKPIVSNKELIYNYKNIYDYMKK